MISLRIDYLTDKIGIIITARMTSKRFPNKVLARFRGQTVLDHVVDNAMALNYLIIMAIPERSDNDVLEDYCLENDIKYYRGYENQVLVRVLGAAKKFGIDIIIKLGADSPDTRPEDIVDNLEKFLDEGQKRMIWGQNSFIFRTDMLEHIEKNSVHAEDREHCGFHWMTNTIDYPDDIERLE